ncbi:MAG: HEPN domain-containing protein [Phenylobacterium sp.]|nr:HEPN domain-containing protein [Phenylobacterium sp.]
MNKRLKKGRPFFVDIVRDGIALYEAPDQPFEHPEPLSPTETLSEATQHFEKWHPSSGAFFSMAQHAAAEGNPNEAAFAFHQATERLYHCVLLVLTLYSPKSHKLNFLRSQAERLAPELIVAWPRETNMQQRCFELLRRAYVDARYSPHYKISPEELAWLSERIAMLEDLVAKVCQARLVAMRQNVAESGDGPLN